MLPAFLLLVALASPYTIAGLLGAAVCWFIWAALSSAAARRRYLTDVATFRGKEDLTPSEFEQRCAEAMRLAGWSATITGRSGDQGVDVLAERRGVLVVLQCKRSAKHIGNKAVQE